MGGLRSATASLLALALLAGLTAASPAAASNTKSFTATGVPYADYLYKNPQADTYTCCNSGSNVCTAGTTAST